MQTFNGQTRDGLNREQFTSFLPANTTGNPVYAPSTTAPASSVPVDNSLQAMLNSLQDDEMRRHQQSNNGPGGSGGDDPYANLRLGVFPVQGARPPRVTGPLDPSFVQRFSVNPEMPQDSAQLESASHTGTQTRVDASRPADDFTSFLCDMPSKGEDPSRHMMFTELIRLKTRSLELQIAQAQQKAKEAEVELARWRDISDRRLSQSMEQGVPGNGVGTGYGYTGEGGMGNSINLTSPTFTSNPPPTLPQQQMAATIQRPDSGQNGSSMNPPTPMTNFDFESLQAMTFDSNLENLFSFLEPAQQPQPQQLPTSSQANMINQSAMQAPNSATSGTFDPSNIYLNNLDTPFLPPSEYSATPLIQAQPIPSPHKRIGSPSSDNEATSPPTKRSKRTIEKKVVVERMATCTSCHKSIARIMFRAQRERIPEDISIDLKCPDCAGVENPSTVPDSNSSGTSIGTVEMRKRLRATLEIEDEERREVVRRQWCDVCQRVVAAGRLVGGEKDNLSSIAEIVCAACDSKYQRCTDCGGGGGPRIGIGKWRMKQVFPPGRKTCSLSHNRIGDRPRELGVHVTPTDFNAQQLKEVLTRTKGLWNEKTLARLAVPEMLEIDLPPDVLNPLKDYADVEDIVTRNWPTREAMIRAEGADPNRFKRILGLIWAHPRSRRAVRTVDLENEEYAKTAEDEDDDMSTVLENVKKTNLVIPPGSELVNMWGGEWDMQNGSLLISTLIPFEGADGDDSTALSVGEMITKVQALRQSINEERTAEAQKQGKTPELLPQCEHLWVVSGGTMPLVREKIAEVLTKKRSFVHVEEYLTRHPEFIHALKARPVGLHPDLHKPVLSVKDGKEGLEEIESRPLILVRWLGRDFDDEKIRGIKLQEFGGKARTKRKSTSKPK